MKFEITIPDDEFASDVVEALKKVYAPNEEASKELAEELVAEWMYQTFKDVSLSENGLNATLPEVSAEAYGDLDLRSTRADRVSARLAGRRGA